MAYVQPALPNLADFIGFAVAQGIAASAIPLPVLTVTGGGSGYTVAPAVTIAPPATVGLAMTATATIDTSGAVTALTPTFSGTNYGALPTLTIAAPSSGTQATGAVTSLGSAYPASALNQAMDLTFVPLGGSASLLGELSQYVRAVYNLGVHLLVGFAQDVAPSTFFADARKFFTMDRFRPGIVMATGDQSTSQTYIVPQFIQTITLEALEATKTPWGRQWVAYQQMWGPTVWGLT